jgi:hypothetical protein
MKTMMEYPEVPPIPEGWKMPPSFSIAPLWSIYEKAVASKGRAPTEIAAIDLADWSVQFLVDHLPPPGSDYLLADKTTHPRYKVYFWMNRTQPLLDYLDAYLAEVRREGTPEQLKFLGDILDPPTNIGEMRLCPTDDDDDYAENIAKVESYPEPAEAIPILERIAQSHATTSIEYVALQIAIRALRYVIESGEAPEFMRYVDQMSKWDPPSVE